jgi:hypothetical protein
MRRPIVAYCAAVSFDRLTGYPCECPRCERRTCPECDGQDQGEPCHTCGGLGYVVPVTGSRRGLRDPDAPDGPWTD